MNPGLPGVPPDAIGVNVLFQQIDDCFQQVEQWEAYGHYDHCLSYQSGAKAIIEILESTHCGSRGGVDCGFPNGKDGLKLRARHLLMVYGVTQKFRHILK